MWSLYSSQLSSKATWLGPGVHGHIANVLRTSIIHPPSILAATKCWPEGDHSIEVPLYLNCHSLTGKKHSPSLFAGAGGGQD